jgi:hypothetical protein
VHNLHCEKITMGINSTGIIRAKFIGRLLSSILFFKIKSHSISRSIYGCVTMVFSSFIALTFSMRHIRDGVILLVAFKTIVFVFGHIWASLSHEDRGRDDRVRPRLVRRSLRLYGASWRHHEIRRRISFDLNSVIYPISLKISLWFKLRVCVHSGDRVWSVMDLSCKRSLCSIVLRI